MPVMTKERMEEIRKQNVKASFRENARLEAKQIRKELGVLKSETKKKVKKK